MIRNWLTRKLHGEDWIQKAARHAFESFARESEGRDSGPRGGKRRDLDAASTEAAERRTPSFA